MTRRIAPLMNVLTTLAVVLSLVSLGFAHKSMAAPLSEELIEFVAAGGSLDDLCGGTEGGTAGADCPACRIADHALDLTHVQPEVIATTLRAERLKTIARGLARTMALDPARLTRAPPLA